jgi:hypothetical protein
MAENDVSPVEGQDCPYRRAYGRMRQDHHDWLLGFEERGVAGVGEIIDYLESDADDCGSSDVYHVPLDGLR